MLDRRRKREAIGRRPALDAQTVHGHHPVGVDSPRIGLAIRVALIVPQRGAEDGALDLFRIRVEVDVRIDEDDLSARIAQVPRGDRQGFLRAAREGPHRPDAAGGLAGCARRAATDAQHLAGRVDLRLGALDMVAGNVLPGSGRPAHFDAPRAHRRDPQVGDDTGSRPGKVRPARSPPVLQRGAHPVDTNLPAAQSFDSERTFLDPFGHGAELGLPAMGPLRALQLVARRLHALRRIPGKERVIGECHQLQAPRPAKRSRRIGQPQRPDLLLAQ